MESRSSVLKMKEDKTLEFIDLYHKEECLWNTTLTDYKRKEERVKAANRVAQALNIPNFKAKHVVMKFKNLRNSYCQELRKIAASLDLGEDYKPKVVWFPKLDSFLRPHLSRNFGQNGPDNLNFTMVNLDSVKQEDWEISVDDSSTQEYYSEDGHSSASTSGNLLVPMAKRPKLEAEMDTLISGERVHDYYDDFGKYIASLLRTLPPKKALALQPKIVHFITDSALTDKD